MAAPSMRGFRGRALGLDQRLHVVMGKGGVGRTTVAATLAKAMASRGKRVLVCEIATTPRVHRLFDAAPTGPEPAPLAPGVSGVMVTPRSALRQVAMMKLPMASLYHLTFENRGVSRFLDGIPGLPELLMLGKCAHHATEEGPDGPVWDAVVVDAPATGHGIPFLRIPGVILEVFGDSPITRDARWIQDLLRDPDRTAIHIVALPEDLPVSEALELGEDLRTRLGLPVGAMFVNQAMEPWPDEQLPKDAHHLETMGQGLLQPDLAAMLQVARQANVKLARQAAYVERLRAWNPACVEFPRVREPGPQRLERLVERLLAAVSGRSLGAGAVHVPVWRSPAPGEIPGHGWGAGWVRSLVSEARVLVTLGSGGVGKTTLAAALGYAGAMLGRRTMVLTIDPAKRLARALGLSNLLERPQRVDVPGADGAGGLWAMMLDASRTLDRLVSTHAKDPETRDRILGHRLYGHMARSLAGSHDLAAMEQLYELHESGDYDLLILDTPPKEHAFDFLDAGDRLAGLLARAGLRWLLLPMAGEASTGAIGRLTSAVIIGTLARFTGREVLRDIATLTLAIQELGDGIRARAERVGELLSAQDTAFLVVSRPDAPSMAEAESQAARLVSAGYRLGGLLLNRCRPVPLDREPMDLPGLVRAAQTWLPPDRAEALVVALARATRDALRDAAQERSLFESVSREERAAMLPELMDEVHSVAHLEAMARLLLREDPGARGG